MPPEPATWWSFIEGLKGTDTTKRFAGHIGVSVPTLNRWRRGARPEVAMVLQVADTTGTNRAACLVAAGYLTDSDVEDYAHGELALADVPTEALLTELLARLQCMKKQVHSPGTPLTPAEQRRRRAEAVVENLYR